MTALLLLHGLGATRAVWSGVADLAADRWDGPVVAPDLAGHGDARRRARHSFGAYAADVAAAVPAGHDAVAVGHSMGGVVALALASGWFGVAVPAALGIGIKVRWAPEELQRAQELAGRPVRSFAIPDEAIARYLRVAGLDGLVRPDDPVARDGVVEEDGGWRLAQDPATFRVGAPDMPGLLSAARGRVVLAAGEHDPMSRLEDLRALHPDAAVLPGLGHNAHVEDPEAVWRLIGEVADAGSA